MEVAGGFVVGGLGFDLGMQDGLFEDTAEGADLEKRVLDASRRFVRSTSDNFSIVLLSVLDSTLMRIISVNTSISSFALFLSKNMVLGVTSGATKGEVLFSSGLVSDLVLWPLEALWVWEGL